MKQPANPSRRNFLNRSAVLTGSALGVSVLPLSAAVISDDQKESSKAPYKVPLFDPTLENYPGYSAYIEVPRIQEVASAARNLLDTQLT